LKKSLPEKNRKTSAAPMLGMPHMPGKICQGPPKNQHDFGNFWGVLSIWDGPAALIQQDRASVWRSKG
jgi:hypothetical protein